MKKFAILAVAAAAVFYLSGSTGYAQGRGHAPAAASSHAPETHGKSGADAQGKGANASGESKFVERINNNPQLKTKVESLLPAGTTLDAAAAGFKNQGQFIAALHVSKNLNIPFDQLKAKMTGTNSESLGKAIHDLKPDMTTKQADAEAVKAEKQAKETESTKSTS